jgi:hypothetical protein
MLQELLSDQHLLFFTFHAFIIGASIGFFVAYSIIQKFKKQLKNQVRAYEDLVDSFNTTDKIHETRREKMHVVRMDTPVKKVSGLAY